MYDEKMLNTITDRVEELLNKYTEALDTIEDLRQQLATSKALNETKSNEIARLEEELRNKNIESDDIVKKIEAVLGK